MRFRFARLLGLGLLLIAGQSGLKADHRGSPLPPCEPGYQWVEEPCHQQVERHVCKLVPDVKKVRKIVYTTKEVPFCLRKHSLLCGQGDCGEGACPKCRGPYTRKILVKTEITCDEPTMKCVTEKVVETVPSVRLRKIPCAAAPVTTPTRVPISLEQLPYPARR